MGRLVDVLNDFQNSDLGHALQGLLPEGFAVGGIKAGLIGIGSIGAGDAAKVLAAQQVLAAKVLTGAGEVRFSVSVAEKYATTRPYITPLSVQEAIAGGVRVADPQRVPGRFMYTVDAAYNKRVGKFEVLVNEFSNTVEHALFKSRK